LSFNLNSGKFKKRGFEMNKSIDYTVVQAAAAGTKIKEKDYWINQLSGQWEKSHFPYDQNHPAAGFGLTTGSGTVTFRFSPELHRKLEKLSSGSDPKRHMILTAGLVILMARYTGNKDIIIASAIYKPDKPGTFINTELALRNRLEDNMTFKELLLQVRQTIIEAVKHQAYPVDMLPSRLNLPAGQTGFPLYDTAVILENIHYKEYINPAHINILFSFQRTPRGMKGEVQYNTHLYGEAFVRRIIHHFINIMTHVLDHVDSHISRVEMMSEEEKQQVLIVFNRTGHQYPRDKTLHRLYEEQVARTPDSIAVVGIASGQKDKEQPHMLTYRELNERTNHLAQVLREQGIQPDIIVGLLVERLLETIIGILGILKAGGAYLPIDPAYPQERIDYMLKDSGAKILVTTPGLSEELKKLSIVNCQLLIVNEMLANRRRRNNPPKEANSINNYQLTIYNLQLDRTNLAYVIYTSGSTGLPKGVLIEHASAVNVVGWFGRQYRLSKGTRLLLMSNFTFDASVNQIFGPLLYGAAIFLPEREMLINIPLLRRYIDRHRIHILYFTPAMLKELLCHHRKLDSVKVVISGGDRLDDPGKDRMMELGYTVYNQYGPTETTIDALTEKCSKKKVTLGKPISNVNCYILTEAQTLLPIGIVGELYIGGAGLARGYVNQPELTNSKFQITDKIGYYRSYRSYKSYIIYKTGDLARWLENGNIEFIGRIDYQAKIRGFRIDPGEIERCLFNHPGIKESVVMTREDKGGDKYLCAYIVPGRELEISEVRKYLSQYLPGYMIPAYFVSLEKIPLTPIGKVDRHALPGPGLEAGHTYTAPRDRLERVLVEIWSEVLGIEKGLISTTANFFELGGHSLKAAVLTSKVHKELEVKLELAEVFKHQSIRELAGYIGQAVRTRYSSIMPVEKKEYYPLSSAQKRLYFLQQMELNSIAYNMPLVLPVGKIEKNRVESALKRLITRHESLRTSFEMMDREPVQRIHDKVDFEIEYKKVPFGQINAYGENLATEDTEDTEEKNYKKQITNKKETKAHHSSFIIHHSFVRPFDLSQAPPVRSGLIRLPDGNHYWMVDIHHIVSDGTSHSVLAENFVSFYQGEDLPPLRLQYKDFSQWQNRLFASGEIKAQENYWLELYPDAAEIPRLNLPTDFKRPEVFTFAGDHYRFKLEAGEAAAFRAVGSGAGATLYMNLLAVLNTLFYKTTGQTDIIIGSGIAGRPHADLQPIIGMFVNSLAMRNYPEGEKPYVSFLKEVMTHSIKAFENQEVQFEELVEKLDPERDPSRNPLFDVALVVQNYRQTQESVETLLGSKNLPTIEFKNKTSKFDITFFVYEAAEEVYFVIEFYTGIFKEETIRRLIWHFKNIIKTVTAEPFIKIKDIDMLSPEEKKQVLYECNQTAREYPEDKTIHELFENQAAMTPDHTVLVGRTRGQEGTRGLAPLPDLQSLTYNQLNKKSNQLANYLSREKNIGPGHLVGILMDNSIDLVIAILGILKAGGAYVPMDPSLPRERTGFIIRDTSIGTVISSKKYIKILNRLQWENQCLHTYLCMDSRDIYKEDEAESSPLMDEELWRHVGETAEDEIAGGGWVSSYTGEKFSRPEMDEYGDNILKKLEPLLRKNMRVLEIGTASGITMFRLAPRVGFYYGTDLSAVIIEKNKKRAAREGHQNIKLACLAAHEIQQIEEKDFDLIIINSVIHCFPGHQYLRKVIGKLIDLLDSEGYLFIGDIMDQDLKENLIRDMHEYKRTHITKNSKTKTDWSAELFVSRGFFADLSIDIPFIASMEFSRKIYTIENELTKFRYDALLFINKEVKPGKERKKKQKIQEDIRILDRYPKNRPIATSRPIDAAYVIYTSGTTGKPKGVMIRQQSLVNYTHWASRQYVDKKREQLGFPLYTNVCFDLTVTSIYVPLITGNRIVIYEQEENRLPILDVVSENNVDIIKTTPSHLKVLQADIINRNTRLKRFIVGGEELETRLAREVTHRFNRDIEIFNEYGPTEATVGCMIYKFDETKDNRTGVAIGKPIDNARIYILDSHLNPVPPGAPGEIYISGDVLAQGYLNDPEKTAERFCLRRPGGALFEKTAPPGPPRKNFLSEGTRGLAPLFLKGTGKDHMQPCIHASIPSPQYPITPLPHFPIYRTGDLARWLPEGNMEFLGRIDDQVKLRGFRIEPGEIESRVLKHQLVKETVVINREDQKGENYLCAYVVLQEEFDLTELKEYLAGHLPDYMIPAYFVKIDKIPLTANAKLDRKALPSPGPPVTKNYLAPRNKVEEKLVDIWSEILSLQRDKISIDADFFHLGGHSLKATILASQIQKELEVKVPLTEIFRMRTIRQLAGFIDAGVKDRFTPMGALEKKEYYPLSSAQERFYILQRVTPDSTAYNMTAIHRLNGSVEKKKFEDALNQLIKRHETLRTAFVLINGQPVQRVQEEVKFEIEYHKVEEKRSSYLEGTRGLAPLPIEPATRGPQPAAALISSFIRSFDLSCAPLLRLGLIKLAEETHILMFDMHHIISDGTSMVLFLKEFMAFCAGNDLPLLTLQYKDFALWRKDWLKGGELKKQEAYWLERFRGEVPVLNMPLDFPRPPVQGFAGDRFDFRLEKSLTQQLKRFIQETGTTLFMVLLAVYNVLLARYTGQEDIVIGTTIAGRSHADLQDIIGLFIETLALRNYPAGDQTFSEFLYTVKHGTLDAYDNQDYPFKELIKKLGTENEISRNPVFDAMLMVHNFEVTHFELEGLGFSPYEFPGQEAHHTSKVDFTLEASELTGEIHFFLEYCTLLYKRETMDRFARHFINIIREVVKDPGIRLSAVEMIDERERQQLLAEFNTSPLEIEKKNLKTVIERFEEQVEKTPDNIAVIVPLPIKNRTYRTYMTYISYRELNKEANRLAHLLMEKGVQPGTIVGIMVEPSLEMVIAVWGILKAGAAYLPIDPDYPEERINYMLKDSKVNVLIKKSKYFRNLIVEESIDSTSHPRSALTCRVSPANMAYIIYTSGSTGRPRGVMVEHGSLIAYIRAFENEFDLSPDDTVIQQFSYAFDAFVEELYPVLLNGGKLAIPGKEVIRDIPLLCDFIARHQVTLITCSPQLLNELNYYSHRLSCLRILISGGDRLKAEYIDNLLEIGEVYNTYGPTESTVCVTYYRCCKDADLPFNVPIGSPITGYRVYILDRYLNLLPVGVGGELCVSGAGVTRGYLNRPELTAEKFLSGSSRFYRSNRSYRSYIPKKIYKTGDLARWLPDGNIEFLGRIDRQVKVRGYRIELGEIENRLLQIENIKKALVIERERKSGQNYLAAYVVVESREPLDTAWLKSRLSEGLPGYMVPSHIMAVEEIPLTPSGKPDRERLVRTGIPGPGPYTAPQSHREKRLAEIWQEVLEKDSVGPEDNFFDLGGTSLDIFKVNARIKEEFEMQIPVVSMFKYSTVRSLVRFIDEELGGKGISPRESKEVFDAVDKGWDKLKTWDIKETGFEIAVIGMAGLFPGASGIDEFWENLKNGIDSIGFFTGEELLAAGGVEAETLEKPGYVKARGIIERCEYFDAHFFGYSPMEARIMDPQMRVFSQCVWHALEHAGYDPFSYHRKIGLYAGATPNIYREALTTFSNTKQGISGFLTAQLVDKDFMCSHISYKLNLKGPSFTFHTACSTSLVAIHLAVQGLLQGECEMALAGGVSIAYPPQKGYLYQEGMIYSADGHHRTFDSTATGSVFGDGAGVVVLKNLVEAKEERDYIYAVIRGSAINNDGMRKVGFTAPSIDGQVEVIKAAQLAAGVEPDSITYLEAHGTATPLGDTVEIEALKQVFNTGKKRFCAIGTVKTNVGHLYSAAGAAGFIKTVLALKHRLIPPSLHFYTPNPQIDFDNSPFYVNTRLKEWKSNGCPLRAGVSSFGIGGTNAHVILEEAPAAGESVGQWVSGSVDQLVSWSVGQWVSEPVRKIPEGTRGLAPLSNRQYQLILLSAKTPAALDKMTRNLTEYFEKNLLNRGNPANPVNPGQNPGLNLADAAYTLQVGRKAWEYRKMLVCSHTDINEIIEEFSDPQSRKVQVSRGSNTTGPLIFMFPGLGAQYIDMGAGLYRSEPVFRQELDRCFEILRPLMDCDIKAILYPGKNKTIDQSKEPDVLIDNFDIAQVVIFAFEYALAALLMEWGLRPGAMIGYSLGEYTAACLAGVLDLEDALKMITARGRLLRQLPRGLMLSVPLEKEQLEPLLLPYPGAAIAIDNGPSCVVAGPVDVVTAVEEEMKTRRCICMRINTSRALHSPLMEPLLLQFTAIVNQFTLKPPQIPYISNVTGTWITDRQAVDPGYWARHLRETVRFSQGIKELMSKENENAVFLEVGPGRDLSALVLRHLEKKPGFKTLHLARHPGQQLEDVPFLLNKLGRLWLWGVPIDWRQFYAREKRYRVPLPLYPFAGRIYPLPEVNFKLGTIDEIVPQQEEEPEQTSPPLDPEQRPVLSSPYQAPATKIEKRLVRIWEDFFSIPRIGIHDDFLELGGDSLKAITFLARLRQEMNVDMSLTDFFRKPTINALVEYMDSREKDSRRNERIPLEARIEKVEEKEYYLLPPAQRRFYILQQMHKDSPAYNMPLAVILEGKLEKERLERVFAQLIHRHESLRTSFTVVGSEPVGVVHPSVPFEIEYCDASQVEIEVKERGQKTEDRRQRTEDKSATHLSSVIRHPSSEFIRPFDLSQAPLLRVRLVKLEEQKHLLMVDMHHIVSDGVSQGILISDFRWFYRGEAGELPALYLRYRDFAQWQIHWLGLEQMNSHETFWLKRLDGRLPVLHLPTDFPRPTQRSHEGTHYDFTLGKDLTQQLRQFIKQRRTTLYIVLLTVLNILLYRYTGQEDIIVGSPIAGRYHADLEHLIGLLIGSVMMRNFPNGTKAIDRFLEEVKENTLSAYEHQAYPFEELLKKVNYDEDPGRTPITDISLIVQEPQETANKEKRFELNNDLTIAPASLSLTQPAKVDITLNAHEADDDIFFSLVYCTRLFKEGTMKRLARHFMNILLKVMAEPGVLLADLDMSDNSEKQEVMGLVTACYPLSHPQKRIYYTELRYPGTGCNNLSFSIHFQEQLDKERLERAINAVIRKNDGLRLRVVQFPADRQPMQYVHPYEPAALPEMDFSSGNMGISFDQWAGSGAGKPFELYNHPLFYFAYIRFNHKETGYYMKLHHLVCDGWTTFLLFTEIYGLYCRLEAGKSMDETPNPSYINFIPEEKAYLQSPRALEDKDFWHQYLLPLPESLDLSPLVKMREKAAGAVDIGAKAAARAKILAFPPGLSGRLEAYRQENKTSIYKLIMAGLALCLWRITGNEDIVIGSAGGNRSTPDHKQMVGMFVSTIPIRIQVTEAQSKGFGRFLEEVGQDINRIIKHHQRYPFDLLAEEIRRETGVDPGYLLNINLVGHGDLGEERFRVKYFSPGYEPTPLAIHINTNNRYIDGLLELEWDYQVDRFSGEEIEILHQGLVNLLADALDNPGKSLAELELLSRQEKELILFDFNRVGDKTPHDKTIYQLFTEQVEQNPDYIAIVGPSEMKYRTNMSYMTYISYRELNETSHQLACLLRQKGVSTDTIVGLMLERSLEMIIGILGILKAGGAYLPIDPEYPEDRIGYILKDSGAKILVTIPGLSGKFEKLSIVNCQLLIVNEMLANRRRRNNPPKEANSINNYQLTINNLQLDRTNLAYIIYTSGTTGRPRGVAAAQCHLVSYIHAFLKEFDLQSHDTVIQQAAYTFDAFVEEMYPILLRGGKLAIPTREQVRDIKQLAFLIARYQVTMITCSPLMLNELNRLDRHLVASIRIFISGGDILKREYIENFLTTAVVYNTYGPTETTVCATYYRCQPNDSSAIPIGKPITGYRVTITNRYGQLLPVGVTGELCITGSGVSKGYLNRPELTAERFLDGSDRFYKSYKSYRSYIPKKIYKTGDLGRWQPDGNIEFLGRIDYQVKIRGFRIEPGEIEAQLLALPGISDAVVAARQDKNRENYLYLCAYIVSNKKYDITELRQQLARQLPVYMIPSFFVMLEKLPVTSFGKIDINALPQPGSEKIIAPSSTIVPPGDDFEKKLVHLWAELLGMDKEKIGIESNFFELGGHSLNAVTFTAELYNQFRVELPVTLIFELQTIKKISRHLKEETYIEKPLVNFNPQNPKSLFCFPPGIGFGMIYKELSLILSDYRFYAFNFIEEENRVKEYVRIIKELQPDDSYILLGYSAAASLVFEICNALENSGCQVSDIIFLDCIYDKEPRAMTEQEKQDYSRNLEAKLEQMGLGFVKEKVITKSLNYVAYVRTPKPYPVIKANIHLVLSQDTVGTDRVNCWQPFTNGSFWVYNGFGSHYEMLDPDFLEQNAKVIREILTGNIEKRLKEETYV
jgi:amino acid adenylation domain-containing protein